MATLIVYTIRQADSDSVGSVYEGHDSLVIAYSQTSFGKTTFLVLAIVINKKLVKDGFVKRLGLHIFKTKKILAISAKESYLNNMNDLLDNQPTKPRQSITNFNVSEPRFIIVTNYEEFVKAIGDLKLKNSFLLRVVFR